MINLLLTTYIGFPSQNAGGPNRIIFEILNGINYSEFDVHYLSKYLQKSFKTFNDFSDYKLEPKNKKYHITNRLFHRNRVFRSVVTHPFYLKYHFYKNNRFYLTQAEKYKDVDIIHAHDVLSLYYFKDHPAQKILTIHSKGPIIDDLKDYHSGSELMKNWYSRFNIMEDEAIKAADVITFPSFEAKKMFSDKNITIDESKVKIIYNGIDIEKIKQLSNSESSLNDYGIKENHDLLLLNVANHIKVKNISPIIKAVHYLKRENDCNPLLVNVGIGPETNYLQEMINKMELRNNVVLLGSLSNDEIIKFMNYFDYFIMASERVVFDLVILEAMACGMIVIANNNGGNKEMIKKRVQWLFIK